MNKKAAIELSVNFIVGMIIGIALFSFGIYFISSLLNIEPQLPDYSDEAERACVSRGESVCLLEKTQTIRVRKYGYYGLVINNLLGVETDFKPIVEFSYGMSEDGDEFDSLPPGDKWFNEVRRFTIDNNDYVAHTITFTVPGGTDPGDYVFNVYVCYDGASDNSDVCPSGFRTLYGPVNQLTVRVP